MKAVPLVPKQPVYNDGLNDEHFVELRRYVEKRGRIKHKILGRITSVHEDLGSSMGMVS